MLDRIAAFLILVLVLSCIGCTRKKTGEVLDKDGIPYYVYNKAGKQRNPLFICNQARRYAYESESSSDSARIKFNNCTNWLENRLVFKDSMATLPYTFRISAYNLDPPWYSGLANSRCIEVFMKAYEFTSDSHYLELCEKLLTSLTVPTEKGGNLNTLEGDWWYAEYASPFAKSPFVLNGMISTVRSIHRYNLAYPSARAARMEREGIASLKANLHRFNHGGRSYYSLDSNEADRNYYRMHIWQMAMMHQLTNDDLFLEMRKNWIDHYNATLKEEETALDYAVEQINYL